MSWSQTSKSNDDIHTIGYPHSEFSFSPPVSITLVSCSNNDRDGHGDTSERDIRRHSLSYSSAFEEDPREPVHQLKSSRIEREQKLTHLYYGLLDLVPSLERRCMCKSEVGGRGVEIGS
jgi:hypothetical protein